MAETVDAKVRLGRAEALRLARGAQRVIAAKGKTVVSFDMQKDSPTDAELLAVLLGPTGNLRAPALQVGETLLVGFSECVYSEQLRR